MRVESKYILFSHVYIHFKLKLNKKDMINNNNNLELAKLLEHRICDTKVLASNPQYEQEMEMVLTGSATDQPIEKPLLQEE